MILSKLTPNRAYLHILVKIPRRNCQRSSRSRDFFRRFSEEKKPFERDTYTHGEQRQSLKERAMGPPGPNAYSMGKGAVAGGALFGLVALCYYGLSQDGNSALNKSHLWPKYVHDRIKSTYKYLGGSVLITAFSAFGVFNCPPILYVFTRNGIWTVLATMAAMIGTGYVAQAMPYKEEFGLKQIAWMGHCALMGAVIAPMCFLGGPVMARAALYTGGIVGGLSTVAMCAPSDKFLYMGGPLAIGLGLLVATSLASMWLPPTTAVGAGLSSFSIYGGLLIFSGFLLYDTQRVIHEAENHPIFSKDQYDPISAAISVYMDILNIFIRIAIITSNDGKRK